MMRIIQTLSHIHIHSVVNNHYLFYREIPFSQLLLPRCSIESSAVLSKATRKQHCSIESNTVLSKVMPFWYSRKAFFFSSRRFDTYQPSNFGVSEFRRRVIYILICLRQLVIISHIHRGDECVPKRGHGSTKVLFDGFYRHDGLTKKPCHSRKDVV